jgi:hypothetical protein
MHNANAQDCVHCGLRYSDMRTGLTYKDVYEMFWSGSDDTSTWVNKRRGTVLGRWHQLKLELWERHIDLCERRTT